MYREFVLTGNCIAELDTEVKFNIAGARVDGVELVRLDLRLTGDDRDNSRRERCLIKVLRSIKRNGTIQFFVTGQDFETLTTEAEFLKNKYSNIINYSTQEYLYIYVKM